VLAKFTRPWANMAGVIDKAKRAETTNRIRLVLLWASIAQAHLYSEN